MALKQITIDVTNLTPTQRKQIFSDNFNEEGFKQFNKTTANQKTLYNFSYT
jgi:hypothetical protein